MMAARDSCRKLLEQAVTLVLHLARESAGNSMAARIAMIAMTTSNSIRVNARGRGIRECRDRHRCNFSFILTRLLGDYGSESSSDCGSGIRNLSCILTARRAMRFPLF